MNETGKALLTVLEKSLQETEPDQTPQTTAFITELRRTTGGTKRNWPEGLLLDGRQPAFTDFNLAVAQIAAGVPMFVGGPVCGEDELTKLRELQTAMDSIILQAEKYSLSNVSSHIHRIRDQIEADVLAGKDLPEQIVMNSHDSVSRDFRAKQNALIGLLTKTTHDEVVPVAKSVLERFEKVVEDFMRYTEEGDRAICESYGVAYHPSLLWKAAASIAVRFTSTARLPRPSAWATPKSILDGIIAI